MKRQSLILSILLLSIISVSFGQGTLRGKVTDEKGNPLPFANILVINGKMQIGGASSNDDGSYVIRPILPGKYDVVATFIGYMKYTVTGVVIRDTITELDVKMVPRAQPLCEIQCIYEKPKSSGLFRSRGTYRNYRKITPRKASSPQKQRRSGVKDSKKKKTERRDDSSNEYSPKYINDSLGYQQITSKPINPSDNQDTNVQYIYNDYYLKNHNLITEEYDAIIENEFVGALKTPLSTFSIDVDKASYSNMRRFFTQNQRPPVNSVRIEELVNYFNYDYPQPANNDAFSINTEYVKCPWNKNNKLLLVGIQGKKIPIDKVPPTNMIFLIDVSGSMSDENKLPLVKKSLILLVEQMRPIDKIGIAVYAGESGVALESTFCTPENKDKIISSIVNLQSGGATAGASGINLAYNMAAENFLKDGNNRIVLCTDGDFNVGVSDDGELVKLIEEKRKGGVFLSILGFGMGNYKDAKIEKLADKGNGNYAYIDDINEAKRVLVEQFSATIMTIAKDVKIQIEFNPKSVKEYRLIGYENRALAAEDFENDAVDAGEIGSGASVTALYEIIPADTLQSQIKINKKGTSAIDSTANNLLCKLKIRYKAPAGNTSNLIEKPIDNRCSAFENGTNNIRFATSVASFGMLIRFSKFVGTATFESVYKYAKGAANGYADRQEFLGIVKKAHDMYVK